MTKFDIIAFVVLGLVVEASPPNVAQALIIGIFYVAGALLVVAAGIWIFTACVYAWVGIKWFIGKMK